MMLLVVGNLIGYLGSDILVFICLVRGSLFGCRTIRAEVKHAATNAWSFWWISQWIYLFGYLGRYLHRHAGANG